MDGKKNRRPQDRQYYARENDHAHMNRMQYTMPIASSCQEDIGQFN